MHPYQVFAAVLNAAELAACICGFATWRKWRGTPWRMFILYLLFIIVEELFNLMTQRAHYIGVNKVVTQLVILVEFVTAYTIFYRLAATRKEKLLPVMCAIVYLLCWLADTFIIQKLSFLWNSFAYTVGNMLLLMLILRFMIRLAMSDAILSFRRNMMFWVCAGWMLYYTVTLPYYGMHNTLAFKYPAIYISYSYVQFTLNILMYLTFAGSFLWSRPR